MYDKQSLTERIKKREDRKTELESLLTEPLAELAERLLCYKFKELGDLYINLYLDNYAKDSVVDTTLSKKAIEAYEKACRGPFIEMDRTAVDYLYFQMALGNAHKEVHLPSMMQDFDTHYNDAKNCYQQAIDFHFNNKEAFPEEYFFLTLEQMNLEIRKDVWKGKKTHPKRLNVYHSLKSPKSHLALHGVYYFAFLNGFEIWEYRYGKVRSLDEVRKFILDRLNEASAVIFLLSDEYDYNRSDISSDIIRMEVDTVRSMIEKNIPLKVAGIDLIDLGNRDLVEQFQKLGVDIFKIDQLKELYVKISDAKDIYECRKRTHLKMRNRE